MSDEVKRYLGLPDVDPSDFDDAMQVRMLLLAEQFELRAKQDVAWKGRDHAATHEPKRWMDQALASALCSFEDGLTPEQVRRRIVATLNYALCALESFDWRAARGVPAGPADVTVPSESKD